jgi:hypothetical protein
MTNDAPMTGPARLPDLDRAVLDELAPLARRAVRLDPRALVRVRAGRGRVAGLARLPFSILVARSVSAPEVPGPALDVVVGAVELIDWLDGIRAGPPVARDVEWRGGVPPDTGWRRLDAVPDEVVRPLVRSGALALKEAADREGVAGATPRAEVLDSLLDSVVLRVEDPPAARPVEVTLRAVSALTRMAFLPRGGVTYVDVTGRWVRLAAGYGSVFLERAGSRLAVL